LSLVRHALETGTDPVPLVAAIAAKLRTLAKVGAARGRGVDPTRDLGIAPWQVDRARRELRSWDADRLASAIELVAAADHAVKGGDRAPAFSVERLVRQVADLAADA
jgi:DNA polymerase-3 subunit delta